MVFKPLGDRARWRVLLDLLRDTKTGEVLTYRAAYAALGLPDADTTANRRVVQVAMRDAMDHLLKEDSRAVEAVRNEGYRVVEPSRQVDLARNHQDRARREVEAGRAHVTHIDLNGLSPEGRALAETMHRAFSAQADMMRRLDVRQQNLAAVVAAVERKTDRTAETLETVQRQLAWLTSRLGNGEEIPADIEGEVADDHPSKE